MCLRACRNVPPPSRVSLRPPHPEACKDWQHSLVCAAKLLFVKLLLLRFMQQVGKLGPYRVLRDGWRGGTMSFVRQLNDYRLTTAEILYHLPDHPDRKSTRLNSSHYCATRMPS